MEATIFGIDLAKEKFQVCGCDGKGKLLWNKKMTTDKVILYFSNRSKCLIFMEACSGSNFWSRKLTAMGHKVKIIAAQFVKPYVKTNKSDMADALAIVNAGLNPNMRFVPEKSQEKLDIQMIHRIRERLVHQRTALVNEARSIFYEHGITYAKGLLKTEKMLEDIEAGEYEQFFSGIARSLLLDLLFELRDLDKRISAQNQRLEKIARENEDCKRLQAIPGLGVITSTALVAKTADPTLFKNGRQFSAWLGLVPAHTGTGGKTKTLSMSKRGDMYVRKQMIQGALSALTRAKVKDSNIEWGRKLMQRSSTQKATVALANKMGRIVWHLLTHKDETYKPLRKAA